MNSDLFKKINAKEYIAQFIASNTRPDGRAIGQFRHTSLETTPFKTSNSTAQVKFGNSLISCAIKLQVAKPLINSPKSGYIVPNILLPPISSAKFKPGPPAELAQTLSSYILRIVEISNIINLEQLCIVEDKCVWVVFIDIICLNYDGNIFDAALLALTAALKTVKLPKAVYNETDGTCKASHINDIPLTLNRHPLAVTFGIFDDGLLLSDPTDDEESVLSGQITICHDEFGDIISILKVGSGAADGVGSFVSSAISKETIKVAIGRAKERDKELRSILNSI